MFGSSYDGYTQSLTAPLKSKYLKAPVPTVSQQDNFGHWYINGALQLHVPATCLILWARAIGDNPDMSNSYEITKRLPLISCGDGVFDSEFIIAFNLSNFSTTSKSVKFNFFFPSLSFNKISGTLW